MLSVCLVQYVGQPNVSSFQSKCLHGAEKLAFQKLLCKYNETETIMSLRESWYLFITPQGIIGHHIHQLPIVCKAQVKPNELAIVIISKPTI